MKKIMKFLALCLCVLLSIFAIASCGSKQEKEIKSGYQKVVSYIKEELYDPGSLVISVAEGVSSNDADDIYYKIRYNAKNRLGGYVGAKDYYYTYDTATGKVSTTYVTSLFGMYKAMYNSQKEGAKFEGTYYYLKIK